MNDRKVSILYCQYKESFSGLDRKSNHPQHSKIHPEQDTNSVLKAERGVEATEEKSEVNRSYWFMRLKERSHLYNIKVQDEAAITGGEATAKYPEDLAKIMSDGDYTEQQTFIVDGTTLYWKKMQSRTFIASEEKSVSGFRASKS